MEEFTSLIQRVVIERVVVDKTWLTGRYEFDLKWGTDKTHIVWAIKQLGLALEPAENFADALVVDSIEKPNTE